jgi:pimeloyl-ACP methyl ester carboxylesterase
VGVPPPDSDPKTNVREIMVASIPSIDAGPGPEAKAPADQALSILERQLPCVGNVEPGCFLLLVHGWPGTWYAWRLLMPALARDFEVVAVDQRGIGLPDKPQDGYDTSTLADDLVALMDALGHQRFAVVGHDTGFAIS